MFDFTTTFLKVSVYSEEEKVFAAVIGGIQMFLFCFSHIFFNPKCGLHFYR